MWHKHTWRIRNNWAFGWFSFGGGAYSVHVIIVTHSPWLYEFLLWFLLNIIIWIRLINQQKSRKYHITKLAFTKKPDNRVNYVIWIVLKTIKIHPFIHPSLHPSIFPSLHPAIPPFLCPLPSILTSPHPSIPPPLHPPIPSIHPTTLIYKHTYLFTH